MLKKRCAQVEAMQPTKDAAELQRCLWKWVPQARRVAARRHQPTTGPSWLQLCPTAAPPRRPARTCSATVTSAPNMSCRRPMSHLEPSDTKICGGGQGKERRSEGASGAQCSMAPGLHRPCHAQPCYFCCISHNNRKQQPQSSHASLRTSLGLRPTFSYRRLQMASRSAGVPCSAP